MRVVADTNCVVSGLISSGSPRRLLEFAREGRLTKATSPALLQELGRVLDYPKILRLLEAVDLDAGQLVKAYADVAELWMPESLDPVVIEDPSDDEVLACAVTSAADVILSGDRHLLRLKSFRGILIVQPAELVARVESGGSRP